MYSNCNFKSLLLVKFVKTINRYVAYNKIKEER